jgi:carbonic anhydrase/acetyltransferase-like protein (isoleucine patch superfamily)
MRRVVLLGGWMAAPAFAQDVDGDRCVDAYFGENGACVHPTASLASGVTFGTGAVVGAQASLGLDVTVGDGARIGARASIGGGPCCSGPSIGDGATIGRRTLTGTGFHLASNSVVGADVSIGNQFDAADRVTIGYGTVIEDNVTMYANTVVGNLAFIGAGSFFHTAASVGREARIGVGGPAQIESPIGARSVVGGGSWVMQDARVASDVTLGNNVSVVSFAVLRRGAIVEDGAQVGLGATVRSGARVLANANVPPGETVPARSVWAWGMPDQPSLPGLWDITPDDPVLGVDGLRCANVEPPSDPNPEDVLEVTINWYVWGEPLYTGPTETHTYPGDTLPPSALQSGQSWYCNATIRANGNVVDSPESSLVSVP